MKLKNNQAGAILEFYRSLSVPGNLPRSVQVMNPYSIPGITRMVEDFYHKFFSDKSPRIFILGINPGRLGAGVTGIPFTDPVNLAGACGIPNNLPGKAELSSKFIYRMIDACGGIEFFYHRFFLTAVSPLGFTKNGINMNYYDDSGLLKKIRPFIIQSLSAQINSISCERKCAICLGEGKNYAFLSRLNDELGLFRKITPLPHPRWVMQYRKKDLEKYIGLYRETLMNALS